MELNLKEEYWMKHFMKLATVIFLYNYCSQFYRASRK